ncbi:MAG: hypothetical protein IJS31_06910 [Oscillospiraceae bacterium]|nr:hypothetical protein [Oscillospiraceae bacterium]
MENVPAQIALAAFRNAFVRRAHAWLLRVARNAEIYRLYNALRLQRRYNQPQ